MYIAQFFISSIEISHKITEILVIKIFLEWMIIIDEFRGHLAMLLFRVHEITYASNGMVT